MKTCIEAECHYHFTVYEISASMAFLQTTFEIAFVKLFSKFIYKEVPLNNSTSCNPETVPYAVRVVARKTDHVVGDWRSSTLHVGFSLGCVPIWRRTWRVWTRRCIEYL